MPIGPGAPTPRGGRSIGTSAFSDDGRIAGPADFNRLTVGWYLNEPPEGHDPNVIALPGGDLAAARDIATGEELTVDYATFSDRSAAGALGHD